jgi:hypothetical protein
VWVEVVVVVVESFVLFVKHRETNIIEALKEDDKAESVSLLLLLSTRRSQKSMPVS